MTEEGVALLIEDCEKTSAALSMNPTPFQLEQATNFLVATVPAALRNLEEQLQSAQEQLHAEQRDRNFWAANNSRERQRLQEQLQSAREAIDAECRRADALQEQLETLRLAGHGALRAWQFNRRDISTAMTDLAVVLDGSNPAKERGAASSIEEPIGGSHRVKEPLGSAAPRETHNQDRDS